MEECVCVSERDISRKAGALDFIVAAVKVTLNFKSDPFTLKITEAVDKHNVGSKGLGKTWSHTLHFI